MPVNSYECLIPGEDLSVDKFRLTINVDVNWNTLNKGDGENINVSTKLYFLPVLPTTLTKTGYALLICDVSCLYSAGIVVKVNPMHTYGIL